MKPPTQTKSIMRTAQQIRGLDAAKRPEGGVGDSNAERRKGDSSTTTATARLLQAYRATSAKLAAAAAASATVAAARPESTRAHTRFRANNKQKSSSAMMAPSLHRKKTSVSTGTKLPREAFYNSM